MSSKLTLIECPRDAMQGFPEWIPTETKIAYLNLLLEIGFDTLDFGSYVSPKAIPQMKDTQEVLEQLRINSSTRLLAIVANERGVETAVQQAAIHYLGYPFSISETFQQRNTNRSIADSVPLVEAMLEQCAKYGKEAVIYLSMGFGNPYNDPWNPEIVSEWAYTLIEKGVHILSIADTTGIAKPETILRVVSPLILNFPGTEIGVHLHSQPSHRLDKINAAYEAGCRRFDSAILGVGGCPMAEDKLTGNMDTGELIAFLEQKGVTLNLDKEKWLEATMMAQHIFNGAH